MEMLDMMECIVEVRWVLIRLIFKDTLGIERYETSWIVMDLVDILLLDFAFQVDVSDVNYGVSFGKTVDRRGELDEGNEGLII